MTEPLMYCAGCKGKRRVKDVEHVTAKDGRPMLRGQCVSCNGTVTRNIAKENAHAKQ